MGIAASPEINLAEHIRADSSYGFGFEMMQTSDELIAEWTCECKNVKREGIRFCPSHHKYHDGRKELTSVSKVIKAVWPDDFPVDDPRAVANRENARIRGVAVEKYLNQYILTRRVFVETGERQDVKDRLAMLLDWYDASGLQVDAVQKIVHDDVIAGTLDIAAGDMVLDVKCVASLQPQYGLQLGLYSILGEYQRCGIVHVTKDRVKLVPYDAAQCRIDASYAYEWWMTRQRLGNKKE